MLDLCRDECVIARDRAVWLGGDECPGGVAMLALACIGAQPAIQALLAATKCLDAMRSTVERRGRGQPRRHTAGRTLGFSISLRSFRAALAEGCSSAARKR